MRGRDVGRTARCYIEIRETSGRAAANRRRVLSSDWASARSATGAALGAQGTANPLGQTGGTFLDGLLFAWEIHAPFALGFALLLPIGGLVLWWEGRSHGGAARLMSSSGGP